MSNITINLTMPQFVRVRIALERQESAHSRTAHKMLMHKTDMMRDGKWDESRNDEWTFWYEKEKREVEKWRSLADLLTEARNATAKFSPTNPFVEE